MIRIAVDIGGTFTDLIATTEEGEIFEAKVPSDHEEPDSGLASGLSELSRSLNYEDVEDLLRETAIVIQGTTVALNTVLQRKGARTGLLCTRGFQDTLEIRLGYKEERYVFPYAPPPSLVPRDLRIPITERVDKTGQVRIPLDEYEVERAAHKLAEENVEAVAISFLWSFRNGGHERRAEEIVREIIPKAFVTSSSDVLPRIREYNRQSTTVLNAYVGPIVSRYVERTEGLLRELGFTGRVRYIQSNGGLGESGEVKRRPVLLVVSGPAAGPAAGLQYKALAGENLIIIDMGGTSFDTCLVRGGLPDMRGFADINRYRVATPLIDVHTIGAGGGSIAAVEDGLLRVGPESAEAHPGPACYARGGTKATVTDANVVVGLLNQSELLGGRFPIDSSLSKRTVDQEVSSVIGIDSVEASAGIIEVVLRNMADAIREISVQRGHDPRDHTLVAGGGAGGIHAAQLANELGISKIVIPRIASAFCAFGAVVSDLRHDHTRSYAEDIRNLDFTEVATVLEELEEKGRCALREEGTDESRMRFVRTVDLRYKDQVYECTIDASDLDLRGELSTVRQTVEERFHERHLALYDYSQPGYPCEVISLTATAIGLTPPLHTAPRDPGPLQVSPPKRIGTRPVSFDRGTPPVETPIYAGQSFLTDHPVTSPAIIEESNTTIAIPPGWRAVFRASEQAYVLEPTDHKFLSRQITRKTSSSSPNAADPITLGVVSGSLSSTVKEMTVIMQRTARSPVLAIGNDFSNAVYTTVNGIPEMVIQGQDQPVHLGGMIVAVKSVENLFGEDLAPGDVIVRNEPDTGGSHLVDIDVIQPVFFYDRVVAWTCSRAHMGDIGGPVPGGYNPYAEDLFAEGLIIPPIKLVEGGSVKETVWNLILANVHIPDLVRGDMGAQLSAVRMATRRIERLFAKYGAMTVETAMAEMLDRADRLMRAQIAAMPDDVYSGESWIQEDGHGVPDSRIGCTIEVRGDEMAITIDSPPKCNSYRNSYGGCTRGALYYGVISGLEPGLPINEGLYRPLKIDLGPRGTMLNAERPAACAMSTGDVWENVFDAVCDAMSKVVPERACAGWVHLAFNTLAGVDPRHGDPYSGLLHITYQGGSGAVYGMDGGGLWGSITPGGAAMIGDIELLEFRLPLHFHRHELQQDSACPGRWRGALGAALDIEIIDHTSVVAHVGDGTKFPPPSRLGGGSPKNTMERVHRKFILHRGGNREPLPLHSVEEVEAGDRILSFTSGGGGIGPPIQRDVLLVARDVKEGFVSIESAREEYGVIVDPEDFTVDEAQTESARSLLETVAGADS